MTRFLMLTRSGARRALLPILAAALVVLPGFGPTRAPAPASEKPDPRAVLAEAVKDPARAKTLADAWRAFADPRTGCSRDEVAAANARRLLLAWVKKDANLRDWQRLISLAVEVSAKLDPAARADWARIVLPAIPPLAQERATPELQKGLAVLRMAVADEKLPKVDFDDPGPLVAVPAVQGDRDPPAATVFLAWLAVRSYTDPGAPNAAQAAVADAILPTLWAARTLPEA
jgi:hypothetical protein